MVIYNAGKDLYNEEERNLLIAFKADLLEECGLTNHPNADKIYYYAWERGHSAGLYEVYNVMNGLGELFA